MDELRHECGIAAVYHRGGEDVSRSIPRMLLDMQNRGQLAAGMASYRPGNDSLLTVHKGLGSVTEAFRLTRESEFAAVMSGLDGPAAIGHVRYATCGGDDLDLAQPFERQHGRKVRWFAFAFNGQLSNYGALKRELLDQGDYHLRRDVDTEIVMHTISHEIQSEGSKVDWVGVFGRLARRWDGAYNLVLLSATGELVVVRDPLGIRPLCYAEEGPSFAAASESMPLSNLGFKDVHPLPPGHLAIAGPDGVRIERYAPERASAHCFFEWVYFANVASTLDDRSVYLTRAKLGRALAALEEVKDDRTVVVPVPDTAKAAADAMAFALGVPCVEGLMRNRFVGRTFIEGTGSREAAVRAKYTPLPEVLRGKRVLLVEDSIVRSTTMRALVNVIRERGGAAEVHLRVACPPIIAPCYYGIDMSKRSELFATKFEETPGEPLSESAYRAMARELGADSLRYLSSEALAKALELPGSALCRACVTGNYPTTAGQALYRIDAERPLHNGKPGWNGHAAPLARAYEH